MDLLKRWAATREHLRKASESFDKENLTFDEMLRLESFNEFIEHNELGLAFDELETLAETANRSKSFWKEMLLAAEQMNLEDSIQRCKVHIIKEESKEL